MSLATEIGFPFDEDAAGRLLVELQDERETIRALFSGFAVDMTKSGKSVPFNAGSSQQIAAMFNAKGLHSPFKTDGGRESFKSSVLATLDHELYPEAKLLHQYAVVNKRISQLASDKDDEGKTRKNAAILDCLYRSGQCDGRIHAAYRVPGTITGRAACSGPNIQQIPRVATQKIDGVKVPHKGKAGLWGYEFRNLFRAPEGMVLLGADQSGLEIRCFAGYLAKYDNGAYCEVATAPNVHDLNQELFQLDTKDQAKRALYAWLYGAGLFKLGTIIEPDESDEAHLKVLGKDLKRKLEAGITGFKQFNREIALQFNVHKHVIGLDGRQMYPQYAHSALNTVLQGAGATICKQWLIDICEACKYCGWAWGNDYAIMAFVHDEVQIAVRPRLVDDLREIVMITGREVWRKFVRMQCPTDVEVKVGQTWAECH
jgi:DNA polymerase I-like protein with 3'-5' exonuclease and polymerase domains